MLDAVVVRKRPSSSFVTVTFGQQSRASVVGIVFVDDDEDYIRVSPVKSTQISFSTNSRDMPPHIWSPTKTKVRRRLRRGIVGLIKPCILRCS